MRAAVTILQGTWDSGLKRRFGYSYRRPEFVPRSCSYTLSVSRTDFPSISHGHSNLSPLACPNQIPPKTRTRHLFLSLNHDGYPRHRAYISLPLRFRYYRLYVGYLLAICGKLHSCDHGFFHGIPFAVCRAHDAPKSEKVIIHKLEIPMAREEAAGCGGSSRRKSRAAGLARAPKACFDRDENIHQRGKNH